MQADLPLGPVPIRQREAPELVVEAAQGVFQLEQEQPVPGQKAARVVRVRIVYQVLVDLHFETGYKQLVFQFLCPARSSALTITNFVQIPCL